MLESADWFYRHGTASHGASLRISAAYILYSAGRVKEAEAAMPDRSSIGESDLVRFLEQGAENHLALGNVPGAIDSLEEALRLAKTPSELALRQETLAGAYFAAGRIEEGRTLAQSSYDWLSAAHHPDAAGARLTLALVAWRRCEDTAARVYFEEALGLYETAPFLAHGAKARCLAHFAARLEQADRLAEAQEIRAVAQRHLRLHGIDPELESPATLTPAIMAKT